MTYKFQHGFEQDLHDVEIEAAFRCGFADGLQRGLFLLKQSGIDPGDIREAAERYRNCERGM